MFTFANMTNLKRVFLLTGSNLGDQVENLFRANLMIETHIGPLIQKSGIYETEAWGVDDQPDYVNQALEVRTRLEPHELLEVIFEIESLLGRVRKSKWGPRLIDIDILFYENEIIKSRKLTLPHPRIHRRNFAMIPMMEIAPDFIHPVFEKSITELYLKSEDPLGVTLIESSQVVPELF